MSNMEIWNAVKHTDPAHVKSVQQRGGFSAIDAQYTIQRATETFGPVGKGWGYDVEYDYKHLPNDACLIFAYVTVWHGSRENKYGPIAGSNMLLDTKKRIDDDAPKKALTDALTKALSHLGFSADVFLGMYDDNKYVAAMKQKHTAEKEFEGKSRADEIITGIRNTSTQEEYDEYKTSIIGELGTMQPGAAAKIKQAFAEHLQSITQQAA